MKNPPPDNVSIIDVKTSLPRVIAEVAARVSMAGGPLSIAVTPDESLAIVTASNKELGSDDRRNEGDRVRCWKSGSMIEIEGDYALQMENPAGLAQALTDVAAQLRRTRNARREADPISSDRTPLS